MRSALLVLPALVLAGCPPTVGTREANCDEAAARTVAYGPSGNALYVGEALLNQGCSGNGAFCHSAPDDPTALPDRYGAPFGLDFNAYSVELSRGDERQALADLARIQSVIHRYRNEIWGSLLDGSMPPPGGARARTVDNPEVSFERFYVLDDALPGAVEVIPVDALDMPQYREMLRNWLACGAPVVERSPLTTCTTTADCVSGSECVIGYCLEELDPGEGCTSDAECGEAHCDADLGRCTGIGDVVLGQPPPDPTWPSIWERVINPSCGAGGCHIADLDGLAPGDLAMIDMAEAYDALVGHPAGGPPPTSPDGTPLREGECFDMDLVRVVPGGPESSLLIHKIDPAHDPLAIPTPLVPRCGASMPYGHRLPPETIEAVRRWILAGAPET